MKTYGHYINGAYVDPVGGKSIESFNPYTGEVWARIAQGVITHPGVIADQPAARASRRQPQKISLT